MILLFVNLYSVFLHLVVNRDLGLEGTRFPVANNCSCNGIYSCVHCSLQGQHAPEKRKIGSEEKKVK